MSADPVDELLTRAEGGELGDPLPVLAYLAGDAVPVPEDELNGVLRRALLLVAAGGDPRRELTVDDRAVKAVAAELWDDARRVSFGAALDALVLRVRDLPRLREGALYLAGDVELAWRLWALGLLAAELA